MKPVDCALRVPNGRLGSSTIQSDVDAPLASGAVDSCENAWDHLHLGPGCVGLSTCGGSDEARGVRSQYPG